MPGEPFFRREAMQYAAARVLAHLPDRLKIRLSGEPPIVIDGQQLDPQLQLLRSATRGKKMPGLVEPTVAAGRERYRRQIHAFRGPVTQVGAVRDLEIAGAAGPLRARHYSPSILPPSRRRRFGEPRRSSADPSPSGGGKESTYGGDGSASDPRRATLLGSPPCITIYLHGGGFVIGDLDTHDEPCRILCRHAGVHVLSVEYRLAPEHPFPAAVEDAAAALAWTHEHAASLGADPDRVAIGGDSAGANLSAVVSATVDRRSAPIAQLLIYPVTDFRSRRPSQDLFAEGFYLTRADMNAFRDYYLNRAVVALDDPRVSPIRLFGTPGPQSPQSPESEATPGGLRALGVPDEGPRVPPALVLGTQSTPRPQSEDRLGGLRGLCVPNDGPCVPPALVAIAGFDPLRDDGDAYAQAMEHAGARVRLVRFPSLGHGFIHMTGVAPAAQRAMLTIAREWEALLGAAPHGHDVEMTVNGGRRQ